MGRRGIEILLDHLRGKAVTGREAVPMDLIIRQSCGCPDPMAAQASVKLGREENERLGQTPESLQKTTLEAMTQVAESLELDSEWLGRLLAAFIADVEQGSSNGNGLFQRTLEAGLRQAAGNSIGNWQNVISVLRRYWLPALKDDALARALDLCQQARTMIGAKAEQQKAYRAFQTEQTARILREIGASLIAAFDVDGMINVLARELPKRAN